MVACLDSIYPRLATVFAERVLWVAKDSLYSERLKRLLLLVTDTEGKIFIPSMRIKEEAAREICRKLPHNTGDDHAILTRLHRTIYAEQRAVWYAAHAVLWAIGTWTGGYGAEYSLKRTMSSAIGAVENGSLHDSLAKGLPVDKAKEIAIECVAAEHEVHAAVMKTLEQTL
jgi:hypothetical protein